MATRTSGAIPITLIPRIEASIPHTIQRHLQLIYNKLNNHAQAFQTLTTGQATSGATAATSAGSNAAAAATGTGATVLGASTTQAFLRTETLGPGKAIALKGRLQPVVSQPASQAAARVFPGAVYGVATSGGVTPRAYTPVTTAYTINPATDYQIDCTAGTFPVTLPAASATKGDVFSVKNSGTGTITLTPAGTDLIDGSAIQTLATNNNLAVMSTGSGWIIVAKV